MCIWEGAADWYRDMTHHGGILCTFWENWYDMQVKTVQYGAGERGKRSRVHGELVCGPEILSEAELAKNRSDFGADIAAHPLDDDYHRARSPVWSKVKVPFLSAANWGGQGLHPRGNFEGFVRAASKKKWLEAHGIEHWTHFYTDYGRNLQLRFFDYFLHGKKNGWDKQPPVQLAGAPRRPLRRARGKRMAAQAHQMDASSISTRPTARCATSAAKKKTVLRFDAMGDGVTFLTPPLTRETEITGPSAVKLFVSSSTSDADIFVVLRVFSPDLKEVVFQGAIDPHTPVGQGWLRASHRALDKKLSKPYRPYHTHTKKQPLKPGEVVALDIEIWPTSIVVPAGYRVALTIRGKDYVYPGPSGGRLSNFKNELTGCGPFLHDDPRDRPPADFRRRHRSAFRRRGAALSAAAHYSGEEKNKRKSATIAVLYGRNGFSDDGVKAVAGGAAVKAMRLGQAGARGRIRMSRKSCHEKSAAVRFWPAPPPARPPRWPGFRRPPSPRPRRSSSAFSP